MSLLVHFRAILNSAWSSRQRTATGHREENRSEPFEGRWDQKPIYASQQMLTEHPLGFNNMRCVRNWEPKDKQDSLSRCSHGTAVWWRRQKTEKPIILQLQAITRAPQEEKAHGLRLSYVQPGICTAFCLTVPSLGETPPPAPPDARAGTSWQDSRHNLEERTAAQGLLAVMWEPGNLVLPGAALRNLFLTNECPKKHQIPTNQAVRQF